jgi:hypothetical protein
MWYLNSPLVTAAEGIGDDGFFGDDGNGMLSITSEEESENA